MKRYIKAATSWTDIYDQFNAIAEDCDYDPRKTADRVYRYYIKHQGDPFYDEAYERWMDTDKDMGYAKPIRPVGSKRTVQFVIRDRAGNQLSAPSEDDDVLWDRVEDMEARGRRGLYVAVHVPER